MNDRNFAFLFYGFTVAWLIVFVYILTLARKVRRLQAELQRQETPAEDLR